jgi:hypothetical protein
MQVIVLML